MKTLKPVKFLDWEIFDEAPYIVWKRNGGAVYYKKTREDYDTGGCRHREDGPAVDNVVFEGPGAVNGRLTEWYLNGTEYTEEEFKRKMLKKKLIKILG